MSNEIIDDLSSQEVNQDKLAALTAKLKNSKLQQEQETQVSIKIVAPIKRAWQIGVLGSGQAGSRLAESFYKLGYNVVAMNTATQDLEHIQLPEKSKILLEYGAGGASKDRNLGNAAAEAHRETIYEAVFDQLKDSQILLFCTSLGGGSGAGSTSVALDIMVGTGKPVIVLAVLPMTAEDSLTKKNAIETLSELAKLVQSEKIQNLIVIDNAKVETIYSQASQMDFYDLANNAVTEPFDAFNLFSAQASKVKGLDPMELGRILTDGKGLTIFGQMEVSEYEEDTSLAEAVIANLDNGLLASGFDLKQTRYAGVMFVSNSKVAKEIKALATDYAMSMVSEQTAGAMGVFKGVYVDDSMKEDVVKVYTMFSGLGLPDSRVDGLQKEVAASEIQLKARDVSRNLNLNISTGKVEQVSAAEKLRQQIATKKSGFGSLINNSVQDRRKK